MLTKRKACPKCSGFLVADYDTYGKYVHCLQCGFMKDLVSVHQPQAVQILDATRQDNLPGRCWCGGYKMRGYDVCVGCRKKAAI